MLTPGGRALGAEDAVRRGAVRPRARRGCERRARIAPSAGQIAHHFVDAITERYLDAVDALNDESAEIEDGIESWPGEQTRRELSGLRRNVL